MKPSTVAEIPSARTEHAVCGEQTSAKGVLSGHPVLTAVLVTMLLALSLQFWRPLYHLNDDNLSHWLPIASEMHRNLWSGEWPFTNRSLFDGRYNVAEDPLVFLFLSPWSLLFSWLSLTDLYQWLPDIVSTCNLLAITGAFAWFSVRMREVLKLEISDAWIVVASLSYGFTPFNLLVGGSWLGFVTAQASLPLLIASLWSRSFMRGVLLATAAIVYAVYGSHLHPVIFTCLFGGLFAVGLSIRDRNWNPPLRLAAGAALSAVFVLPMLIPSAMGFVTSDRSAGLTIMETSAHRLPMVTLTGSFLIGPFSDLLFPGMRIHFANPAFSSAIAFAFINLPLLIFIAMRRRFSGLELIVVVCSLCAVLLIVRPQWLGELFLRAPFLRSLRWPFREIAELQFFTHFLFILFARPIRNIAVLLGASVSALAIGMLVILPAPTFNPLEADRHLMMSGTAERFWKELKPRIGEGAIVSAASPYLVFKHAPQIPFSLMGAYNFASVLGITNVSGYSPTLPASALNRELRPYHHSGVFSPAVAKRMVEIRPELTKVTLLNVEPTIVEVSNASNRWFYRLDHRNYTVREVQPPPGAEAALPTN
jgi:hypothetical protein